MNLRLSRVIRSATFEEIRSWISESRAPGTGPIVMNGRYYVAMVDQTKVGAVCLYRASWYFTEIKHLVVVPAERRKGYGRRILQLALEKVKTPLAGLTVRSDNAPWVRVILEAEFVRVARVHRAEPAIHLFLRAAPSSDSGAEVAGTNPDC